jgi:hypothetical protein
VSCCAVQVHSCCYVDAVDLLRCWWPVPAVGTCAAALCNTAVKLNSTTHYSYALLFCNRFVHCSQEDSIPKSFVLYYSTGGENLTKPFADVLGAHLFVLSSNVALVLNATVSICTYVLQYVLHTCCSIWHIHLQYMYSVLTACSTKRSDILRYTCYCHLAVIAHRSYTAFVQGH